MNMRLLKTALLAALVYSASAQAGVVLIANPSVKTPALTADQVTQIWLGHAAELPDGTAVTPLDLAEGSPLRAQFLEKVLHKSEQQLRSFWSRAIFTGKGQPPRVLPNAAEVLRSVESTPGAVGYVDSKDVVAGKVKVLLSVE